MPVIRGPGVETEVRMTALDPALKKEIARAIEDALAQQTAGKTIMVQNPCGPNDDRILKLPDTKRVSGLSSSEIYRRMDAGTFPRPVKISAKAVGWKMSAIQAWIASLESAT
jgi:prophage regulatory protein